MNHSTQVTRSDQPPSQRALPWALAILFSLLWGLLAGYAWAGEPAAGPNGENGANGRALSLRPVAQIYLQAEGRPFVRPGGIYVDHETGEVLVTDGTTGQVTIYTHDGLPVAALGFNGELTQPLRAVTNGGGNIYVLNANPRAIRVFSSRGVYLGDFAFQGLEAGARVYPTALTADGEGDLIIADSGEKTARILVYDRRGDLRVQFGSRGNGQGEFQIVVGVATDREGRLYVLDGSRRDRVVQVFDRAGRFIRAWGRREGGPTNFSQPVGIAVTRSGHVVIADALRQTLQVYTQEGDFLGRFGGMGVMPGDLTFPSDVAADGTGRLYVAESVGQRFQILEMGNGSTAVNPGPIGPLAGDPREQVRAEVGAFSNSIRRGRR